ncbi:MAG: hypothetical protein ABSB34_13775, partial [Candidatus Limnocylindrales bacterium]
MRTLEPIRVVELFPLERAALLDLLGSLDPLDWERETACPGWAAVSSGERTTLSNGLRLLVNDGGGDDGPVSIDYAGESGDLAG